MLVRPLEHLRGKKPQRVVAEKRGRGRGEGEREREGGMRASSSSSSSSSSTLEEKALRVYESQKEKSMHCLSVLRGARRRRRRNAVVARAWVGKSREEAAAASLAASRSLLRQVCNLSFLLCSGRAHCLQAQTDSYMLTHSFIHSFIHTSLCAFRHIPCIHNVVSLWCA